MDEDEFLRHGVPWKVVDNGLINLNLQYERSSQASFRESDEKQDFSKIAYKKIENFFGKIPRPISSPDSGEHSCAKAKKSLEQFLRKTLNLASIEKL